MKKVYRSTTVARTHTLPHTHLYVYTYTVACTLCGAIESLTACTYVHTGPLLSRAFSLRRFSPRQRGDEEYEVSHDCQKADYGERTRQSVCVRRAHTTRGIETHATISYFHRAVSLRSVLRRRDDKGAGNSLFMLGTMSAHRRLGLIPNERLLSLFSP